MCVVVVFCFCYASIFSFGFVLFVFSFFFIPVLLCFAYCVSSHFFVHAYMIGFSHLDFLHVSINEKIILQPKNIWSYLFTTRIVDMSLPKVPKHGPLFQTTIPVHPVAPPSVGLPRSPKVRHPARWKSKRIGLENKKANSSIFIYY